MIEAGRRVEFVRAISIARPAIRAVRTKKLKRRMAESTKVHPTCDSVKIPPRGFGDCVAPDQTEARPVSWSSQLLLLRHRICLCSLCPRAESNRGRVLLGAPVSPVARNTIPILLIAVAASAPFVAPGAAALLGWLAWRLMGRRGR